MRKHGLEVYIAESLDKGVVKLIVRLVGNVTNAYQRFIPIRYSLWLSVLPISTKYQALPSPMRLSFSTLNHPSMVVNPVRPIHPIRPIHTVHAIDAIGALRTIHFVGSIGPVGLVCLRLPRGHFQGELLEVLVVGQIIIHSLADHLLAFFSKLLPPLFVFFLDRDGFLNKSQLPYLAAMLNKASRSLRETGGLHGKS